MPQINPTEMFRERQLALLREAEDQRFAARRSRKARLKGRPRSERRLEESWLQILCVEYRTGAVRAPFLRLSEIRQLPRTPNRRSS
jgi:hypothetical protein